MVFGRVVNSPVTGLKISAVARTTAESPVPPATRTRPSWRRVAVWYIRSVAIVAEGTKISRLMPLSTVKSFVSECIPVRASHGVRRIRVRVRLAGRSA